ARRGLRQVGEKLLARARDALARGELEPARRAAAAARELLGGGVAVDEVDTAVAALAARGTQTESLLAAAQAELEGGRLLGDDGAIALSEKLLAADPDNALARAGITRSVDALIAQARAAFAAADLATAAARIDDIARIRPGDPELPELRAELGKQREQAAS